MLDWVGFDSASFAAALGRAVLVELVVALFALLEVALVESSDFAIS